VAEGAALEMLCTIYRTVGSNPTLSVAAGAARSSEASAATLSSDTMLSSPNGL
jgi:hypothetical protein